MNAQVISFRCTLRNRLGHFISSSVSHEVVNQAESSQSNLKGLIEGLQNVRPGERRLISVDAERAYGFYDPSLVHEFQRAELDKGDRLQKGMEISLSLTEAAPARLYRVISATEDTLVLDGNHPLAGQDLVFDVVITEARALDSSDEVQDGTPAQRVLH